MLWIILIHVLFVFKSFISINHPKRHNNRNNGKFHFAVLFNIQENGLQESFFLLQFLQEIFSFGNVISRQKTSLEYPANQSLQHTNVCCWWKLVINYLCSTEFVWYGIIMSILSADDITQAEHYTIQTLVKRWLILMLYPRTFFHISYSFVCSYLTILSLY